MNDSFRESLFRDVKTAIPLTLQQTLEDPDPQTRKFIDFRNPTLENLHTMERCRHLSTNLIQPFSKNPDVEIAKIIGRKIKVKDKLVRHFFVLVNQQIIVDGTALQFSKNPNVFDKKYIVAAPGNETLSQLTEAQIPEMYHPLWDVSIMVKRRITGLNSPDGEPLNPDYVRQDAVMKYF